METQIANELTKRQRVLHTLALATLRGDEAASKGKEAALAAARSQQITYTELMHERLMVKAGLS